MNKIDEYYFFLQKALTEPDHTNNEYFYDLRKDTLFSLVFSGETILPTYRNRLLGHSEQVKKMFVEEIEKVRNGSPDIKKLPRISFEEKKSFLVNYASSVKLRDEMLFKINSFSKNDKFDLENNFIRKEEYDLRYNYEIEQGRFFFGKIKELYESLGISENSLVIW